jgi:hypothetical protein
MAAITIVHSLTAAVANGVHDFSGDALTVALTNVAPEATNTVLADITQIDHTNLSSRVITVTSSTQTTGVYKLVLADLSLTASGVVPTFRYVVIYNDDAANDELIGYYDVGSTVSMVSTDVFVCDFNATTGALQITITI